MSDQSKSKDKQLVCPHCGSVDVKDTGLGRIHRSLPVRWSFKCKTCGKDFTALTTNPLAKDSD